MAAVPAIFDVAVFDDALFAEVVIVRPVLSSGTVQPAPTPRVGTVIAGVPIT
jgi:hypothetical protein